MYLFSLKDKIYTIYIMNRRNQLEQLLSKCGLCPKSVNKYVNQFKRLLIHIGTTIEDFTLDDLTDIDKVMTFFDTQKSYANKQDKFNSFKRCCEVLEILPEELAIEYSKHYFKIMKLAKKEKKYKKATPIQQEEYFTKEDVVNKRENYKSLLTDKYNHKNDTLHLLFSLYSYIPPVRQGEYVNCVVINDPEKCVKWDITKINYVDLKNKKIVANIHKNVKKQKKKKVVNIPDVLVDIIRTNWKKSGCRFLIPHRDCKKSMSGPNITNIIARCDKSKRYSTLRIRRLWASCNADDGEKTMEDIKTEATAMGHSLDTHFGTYGIHSELFHKDDTLSDAFKKSCDEITRLKKENEELKEKNMKYMDKLIDCMSRMLDKMSAEENSEADAPAGDATSDDDSVHTELLSI